MTPLDKEVAEFMEGLEYRWDENNQWWVKIDFGVLGIEQATFFYTATKQAELKARIAELKKVCCCDIEPIDSENSINVCNDEHGTRISDLEAQLNNSNKEKE